jgi:hypothetical protein
MGTAGDKRHDPIATLEVVRAGAQAFDHAGQLDAKDVGSIGRQRIVALSLQHVHAVHSGSAHAHEHFTLARDRARAFDDLKSLRPAGPRCDDGAGLGAHAWRLPD